VGGRRPAILIPDRVLSTFPAAELDAVIRHERAHLARRDPAMNAFESVVAAFWWFHPAVRTLVARRREIREERCDDAVLVRVPGDVYRRALLAAAALAGPPVPVAGVPATGPAASLARRIRRIADRRPAGRCARVAAVLAIATAAALLVPGVRPAAGHAFPVERASR
jgi:beta-lactamase regulating signal transducer with metallopeptidase domain